MSENKIIKSAHAFKQLKDALQGLAKILEIALNREDYLYLAGMDNLEALSQTIPKLLNNSQNKKVIEKFENLEFKHLRTTKNEEITR